MSKNVKVFLGYTEVPLTTFKFNGGEMHVKIEGDNFSEELWDMPITVKANLCSSDDIMTLLLVKDALDRYTIGNNINLEIKYLAYARQDRVNQPGESLSLSVMATLINQCKFTSVVLTDPHSDVATALIDNCYVETLADCYLSMEMYSAQYLIHEYVLVAPDAGASKKTYELAKRLDCPVIQAFKQRDTRTGEITGTGLADYSHIDNIQDKMLIVVDDICDGGRTFVELGKVLKQIPNKGLFLYVTHGIFSHPEGPDVFKGIYNKVFCYNVMFPEKHDSEKYPILVTKKGFV